MTHKSFSLAKYFSCNLLKMKIVSIVPRHAIKTNYISFICDALRDLVGTKHLKTVFEWMVKTPF